MIVVEVDVDRGFLYWSDYADQTLKRAKLDGTNKSVIYNPGTLCAVITNTPSSIKTVVLYVGDFL